MNIIMVNVFVPKCVCSATQLCPTLCGPMGCNLPGFSAHGIFQARILEWGAISCFRGSSWPRDQNYVPCSPAVSGGFFTGSATWEALLYLRSLDKPYIFTDEEDKACLI